MQLVPFQGVEYPPAPEIESNPGQALGVYITMQSTALHAMSEKIAGWFRGRNEVEVIDVGVSDKQGLGFILIEWFEYDIDPLFLAILRDEELVDDYTVYGRELEVM